MIPLKINTWGNFIDKKGKKGRVAIENLPNALDFRIYQDAEDRLANEMIVDEWLANVGYAEYSLVEYFSSVTWEEVENDVVKNAKTPCFMPDKQGYIATALRYEHQKISVLHILTDEDDELKYNIPINTAAWLIIIENERGEQLYGDVIVQAQTLAYFFELYQLKISYPNYFDLESLDGLLEAINYWQQYEAIYLRANDELIILFSLLAEKLTQTSIPNNIKAVTKVLAAWKMLVDSVDKQKNIACLEQKLKELEVSEPIENQITNLRHLSQCRPLLAREQLALDILAKILTLATAAEADALIAQLEKTPTDAQIREILIAKASSKRALLL